MLNLTYICHDGFFLEFDKVCYMLFDFWKDPALDSYSEVPDFIRKMNPELPCYVFISHHHKDHLNKVVFEWAREFQNMFFILSKDTARFVRHILRPESIRNGYKLPQNRFCVLKSGEEFSDATIHVNSFASTDIGNSYLVRVAGSSIFHAGDLNAWIWKDESSADEVAKALADYESILDSIREVAPEIDVVMFPVDNRIGTDYWTGAALWLQKISTRFFIPMHFALADSDAELAQRKRAAFRFDEYAHADNRTVFVGLGERGDLLAIPL